jgi:hypothetical protein
VIVKQKIKKTLCISLLACEHGGEGTLSFTHTNGGGPPGEGEEGVRGTRERVLEFSPGTWHVTHATPPCVCCLFPTKHRRHIMERDDLSPTVVPGGDEISLEYRPPGCAVTAERLGHWDGHADIGLTTSPSSGENSRVRGYLVSAPPFFSCPRAV